MLIGERDVARLMSSITYNLDSYSHLEPWEHAPHLYLDRYFTRHLYLPTLKRKLEDSLEYQYVLLSPNKLCTIGISYQHPLMSMEVERVEFAEAVKAAKIRGKGKKQALKLMPDTKVCQIHTTCGHSYTVRASIKGALMEWNSRLEEDPQLLVRDPARGFLIIIKPPTDDTQKILESCS